jgi:hypothetical protein
MMLVGASSSKCHRTALSMVACSCERIVGCGYQPHSVAEIHLHLHIWHITSHLHHQQAPLNGTQQVCPRGPFILQRDRAAAAEAQSRKIAGVPYLVGYHWWRWVDETPGGRWSVPAPPPPPYVHAFIFCLTGVTPNGLSLLECPGRPGRGRS